MYSALFIKSPHIRKTDFFCKKDLLLMKVLASELGKGIYLSLEYLAQSRVFISKTCSGIPHLEIKIGNIQAVIKEASFASSEDFWGLCIMDCISIGTVD